MQHCGAVGCAIKCNVTIELTTSSPLATFAETISTQPQREDHPSTLLGRFGIRLHCFHRGETIWSALLSLEAMELSIGTAYTASSTEYAGLTLFVAIISLYAVIVAGYRIWFHPHSRFPGPLLARASYGYEFWYDVVRKGQFTRKVEQLHKLYGRVPQL